LSKRFNNYKSYDNWVVGRVYKGDDWLNQFQGKDFTRAIKPNIFKRIVTWYKNNYWLG